MNQQFLAGQRPIFQQTISKDIIISGIGLHSGRTVNLTIKPAPPNSGLQFCRVDIEPSICFKVNACDINDTRLCTVISHTYESGIEAKIGTVEHVLSALSGLNIDNAILEIDAAEMPIVDGSAAPFVFLIQEAGIKVQMAKRRYLRVLKTIKVTSEDKWASLTPISHDSLRYNFKLDFSIAFSHPAINKTKADFSVDLSSQIYVKEISRARTFGFLKDIEQLRQHNLALGGTLDNAVVLDEYRVINKNGLRYDDEFVRHKMLDAIGDLYVAGMPIIGYFKGFKSGHALNNKLLRALLADHSAYSYEFPSPAEHDEIDEIDGQNSILLNV